MLSIDKVSARFGCTREQAAAQFAANAREVREMFYKAVKTRRNVNGYTEDDLALMAATLEARAAGEL